MKILISDAFDPSLVGRLQKYGEVTDDKFQVSTADVVLIRSKTKCTKEYINAAPNLKLIIRGGVGLDNIDLDYAASKKIKVHNTPTASSVAVAELAFALMLALPNHVVKAHNSMVEGKWLKKELKRTELCQKTLGIVGCGRIGTLVARRAKVFDMTVYGCDKAEIHSEYISAKIVIQELIGVCDYLSLHLPLTEDTEGIINKNLIAKMKDGIYIVNTGRGKTVVEEDIVDGLQSGKIAGYATDVYYSDPPENSPLLTAPNVLLTPHIGASTKENLLRIGDIIVELLDDFVNGKL
ncbi:MAG: hydroxyacid dehydrogenase [Actinobacteria bacterium]|nr:hydroxyacid dehydrogenase [Actinomycetota bacterium]